VISSALPRAPIEVAAAFRYLGRVPFTIRDVAAGADHLRRQILFYLEGTDDKSWAADMNGETPRWRARGAHLEKDARQAFRVVSQEGRNEPARSSPEGP